MENPGAVKLGEKMASTREGSRSRSRLWSRCIEPKPELLFVCPGR